MKGTGAREHFSYVSIAGWHAGISSAATLSPCGSSRQRSALHLHYSILHCKLQQNEASESLQPCRTRVAAARLLVTFFHYVLPASCQKLLFLMQLLDSGIQYASQVRVCGPAVRRGAASMARPSSGGSSSRVGHLRHHLFLLFLLLLARTAALQCQCHYVESNTREDQDSRDLPGDSTEDSTPFTTTPTNATSESAEPSWTAVSKQQQTQPQRASEAKAASLLPSSQAYLELKAAKAASKRSCLTLRSWMLLGAASLVLALFAVLARSRRIVGEAALPAGAAVPNKAQDAPNGMQQGGAKWLGDTAPVPPQTETEGKQEDVKTEETKCDTAEVTGCKAQKEGKKEGEVPAAPPAPTIPNKMEEAPNGTQQGVASNSWSMASTQEDASAWRWTTTPAPLYPTMKCNEGAMETEQKEGGRPPVDTTAAETVLRGRTRQEAPSEMLQGTLRDSWSTSPGQAADSTPVPAPLQETTDRKEDDVKKQGTAGNAPGDPVEVPITAANARFTRRQWDLQPQVLLLKTEEMGDGDEEEEDDTAPGDQAFPVPNVGAGPAQRRHWDRPSAPIQLKMESMSEEEGEREEDILSEIHGATNAREFLVSSPTKQGGTAESSDQMKLEASDVSYENEEESDAPMHVATRTASQRLASPSRYTNTSTIKPSVVPTSRSQSPTASPASVANTPARPLWDSSTSISTPRTVSTRVAAPSPASPAVVERTPARPPWNPSTSISTPSTAAVRAALPRPIILPGVERRSPERPSPTSIGKQSATNYKAPQHSATSSTGSRGEGAAAASDESL